MLAQIKKKIVAGDRLNAAEGKFLLSMPLPVLGELATMVKKRFHQENIATFVVDININLTNVCQAECDFCAFYVKPGSPHAFTLSIAEILDKVNGLVELGGTQVMLQGGLNPELTIFYYQEIIKAIKRKYHVYIHAFSPPEIAYMAEREKLPTLKVLEKLQQAGLDSLPGGGAEILADRVRNLISPKKISKDVWLRIMREAHSIGMESTATMMFAGVETLDERIEHLEAIRNLQDETGGFRAFIPWTFSPDNTDLDEVIMAGGGEYLKTLAVSRVYLDNIKHIGSGWVTEGMKVAQIGLMFGADDMGGILMEEKVLESTGMRNRTNIEEIVETIRQAGMTPARRDTEYNVLETFK